ncbi:MAG: peptidylprolyl isomerase [Pseudomonadota bacterium]
MAKLKIVVIALLGVGLMAGGYAWLGNQPAAVAQTEDAAAVAQTAGSVVIATVNGENIYRGEFETAYAQLPPQAQQMGMETIFPLLLERMVDEKLIGIAAGKAIPADEPEVEKQIAELRERIVMQVYFEREINAKLTDEVLQERYEQWKEANPAPSEVHARHILLETEERAKEVLAEVQGGKDFAEAAQEHSTGPSGPNGGDLGYFTPDQMVKPFADAAFAMEPGQVSAEPVKTDFGWHIIKVEDRREQARPGLEEMKDQLSQEATQEIAAEMMAGFREVAEIVTFDIDGNPIPAEEEASAAEETPPAEGGEEQPAQQ